jgi:SAM-dependent methyltransferase
MADTDYEYKGLMVQTWDLFRGDTSKWEDRFFFKSVIEERGQPALDVGCGTGRLLLDFLSEGIDIDGVDNSPEMLALCREKAEKMGLSPNLYLGTMQALDLPRKYQTIIVPSSSFLLLTDLGDAKEAMRRFFDHLLPGGTLAMPFMYLWHGTEEEAASLDWKLTGEKVRPEDGATMRRWSLPRYDFEAQLEHTQDRYEVVRDGEVIATELHERSPATRWYTQEQSVALYQQAGFTDIQVVSGFSLDRKPATEEDMLWCVLARRSSELTN